MMFSILIVAYVFVPINSIGQCVTTSPPNSWLVTTAVGIPEWATAGIALGGNNFCIKGNQSTQQVEVYYHIDLQGSKPTIPRIYHHTILDQRRNSEYKNSCVVKDSRIQLCIPICNSNWQEKVITSALSSGHPSTVAESIKNSINTTGWAITVLKVNYRDPEAHINASVFADSSVWCSVYIGIKPRLAFPYLFEIQLGKTIE